MTERQNGHRSGGRPGTPSPDGGARRHRNRRPGQASAIDNEDDWPPARGQEGRR